MIITTVFKVFLIAYEKERSDSNQKHKTVPPPSTIK